MRFIFTFTGTKRLKFLTVTALAALVAATPQVARAGFAEALNAYDAGQYETAFREWMKLARAGDAAAQRNIGQMYRLGLGVRQDDAKAVEWYRRAAEQGLSRAQANLGMMYLLGRGTEQDYGEAARWFARAAAQGHVISMYNLGQLYEQGLGVKRDLGRAIGWYNLAARAGHAKSKQRLSELVAADAANGRLDDMQESPLPPAFETSDGSQPPSPQQKKETAPAITPPQPKPQPAPASTAKAETALPPARQPAEEEKKPAKGDGSAATVTAASAAAAASAASAPAPAAAEAEDAGEGGFLERLGRLIGLEEQKSSPATAPAVPASSAKNGETTRQAVRADLNRPTPAAQPARTAPPPATAKGLQPAAEVSEKAKDSPAATAKTAAPAEKTTATAETAENRTARIAWKTPPQKAAQTQAAPAKATSQPAVRPVSTGQNSGAKIAIDSPAQALAAERAGRYSQATAYWLRQARAGDPAAAYRAGLAFLEGRGVPRDKVMAYVWWNKAAEKGNADAARNIEKLRQSLSIRQLAAARKMLDSGF